MFCKCSKIVAGFVRTPSRRFLSWMYWKQFETSLVQYFDVFYNKNKLWSIGLLLCVVIVFLFLCFSERGQSMSASALDDGGGDPIPNPGVYTWFRRVIRASIPLPLAVMALLCVAYLLEPQCCDNMNTFSFTLTPQLRYVRGPPPVWTSTLVWHRRYLNNLV